jgi:hypothetical protein
MYAALDVLVLGTITFFSMGLFVYWGARALLFLRGSEEAVNFVLDCDLWWGRKILLALRVLFTPSSQFLSL